MTHARAIRVVHSAVDCALILSLIVSPLVPLQSVAAQAPAQVQPGPSALEPTPPEFTFTQTAAVLGGKTRAEGGGRLGYTLTLTNDGSDAQEGIVLQNPLDPNLQLVTGSLEVTPLAYDRSVTAQEDTPLNVTLTGSDGDGDPLAFSVTATPTHGALSGTAPDLTYTPDDNYAGADSFTFTVNDGKTDSPPATVSIAVAPVNDAPVCADVAITTEEDTVGSADPACSDADLDPLTVEIDGQPSHGAAVVVGGRLAYTPAENYFGADSFTYRVRDASVASAPAQVEVTVSAVNDAPVVQADSFFLNENSATGTAVGTVAYTDAETGQAHTFAITAGNGSGAFGIEAATGVVRVANGTLLDYETLPSYTLTVQVSDDGSPARSETATITIHLNDVNDAPVASPASFNLAENSADGTAVGTVAYTDPDTGQAHTFAIVNGNDDGAFGMNATTGAITVADGTLLDFETRTSYTLTVEVTDSGGLADTATITINLVDVNEAPVVTASTFNVDENSAAPTGVGDVDFVDPDTDQTHTFTITAGNTGDTFAIDSSTGLLTVANSTALNYEADPVSFPFSLTVQVTDSGGLADTGTVTINVNDVDEAPLVTGESYDTIGNTLLEVAASSTQAAPRVFVSGNLLSNDVDPEGAGALTAGPGSITSENGGTVTVNSSGAFTYLPRAGYQGTDTFEYTVTDAGGNNSPGTVQITVKAMVWYVKNNAPAGGSGRSTSPFDTLAAAESASGTGSTIYVYRGDGTTAGQAAGITLKEGQRLIGAGVALDVPVQVNSGPPTTNLLPAATQPLIDHTGGNGVTVTNLTGVEIRGLDMAGNVNAISVSTSYSGTRSLTIRDNTIRSAGAAGIKIQAGSSGTLQAVVQDNLLTATGNGFEAQNNGSGALNIDFSGNSINSGGTAVVITNLTPGTGTTTITGFANNTVDPNTAGRGIAITNASFDATPGGAYQTINAGSTAIGAVGNSVGAAGMLLDNVKGDLNFTDLDIFAGNGAVLQVSSATPFNAATGAGFRLTVAPVAPDVGSLVATGGPVLDVNRATLDLRRLSLTSTNGSGVSLTNVSGTVSAEAGSSISTAAGADFNISGGDATITYGGTITSTSGKSVSVSSYAGTLTFNGAITDTGAGITLTNNTGATILFAGGLDLRTGSNAAFTATGLGPAATSGGTVTVTGANNTITTGTVITGATALTVTNTTIGSDGLTFRSISAKNATNGIVLNNTGTGGLTVTGSGGVGSGGTLENMTADCVSLTSTANIDFNFVNLDNCGNTNGEHGMRFNELTGTALIQDMTISDMSEDGILLTNTSGTLNLTVRRTTLTRNDGAYGEDGFQFRFSGTATARLLVDDSTFTDLQRDGIDGVVEGASTLDLTINNTNEFTNNYGNGGVVLSSNDTATLRLNLTGNTFQGSADTPVTLISMGTSTFEGRVNNNTINNRTEPPTPPDPPLDGYGIYLAQEDNSQMTVEVSSNTIQNTQWSGLNVLARMATGTGALNLTLRNNTIFAPKLDDWGAYLRAGVNGDPANNQNTICLDMGYSGAAGGNTINGSGGYEGLALIQHTGSTFQVEGWDTGAHTTVGSHIQAFNTVPSTYIDGTFTAVAAGSCLTPGTPSLPTAAAFQAEPSGTMAASPAPILPAHPRARLVSPVSTPAGAPASPQTVSVTIGTLPAGKSVTVRFEVTIADPLPEDVWKVANQASITGSNFAGEVLSDATEVILYRPPIAHEDAYTTAEDTPLTVDAAAGVLGNDTAATGYQELLTAVQDTGPASGSLDLHPDGSFTFTPVQDFNGEASFTYHANDTDSDSNIATVRITVTPVDDAPPILDTQGTFDLLPIAQDEVDNPGTLVSAIIASAGGDPIQDADTDAQEGMAVTSAANSHGRWQYTLDGGVQWQDFGAPSASEARLLADDADTRVRFVPDPGWTGTLDAGIHFRAWDRSIGANGGTLDVNAGAAQPAVSAAEATVRITVNQATDLSLAMNASPGPVIAGNLIDYALTVANAGPSTASGVTLTDQLPAGASFHAASPQCLALNGTVTCSVDSLEAGGSLSLTITAAVDTGVHGILTNTASVTAAEADPNPGNNTTQTNVEVVPSILVYSLGDDPGGEWNRPLTTTSPNGTQLLGEYGNETVTLTLEDLPPHAQVIVSFDLYILRSWDGNQVNWPGEIDRLPNMSASSIIGPDRWRLDADGTNLLDSTFSNWSSEGFHQAYPGNYPGGSYPAQTGAVQVNSLGYAFSTLGLQDSTYHLSYPIDHQGTRLVLEFTGSGLESLENESWGLGHVRVVLSAGADAMPFKLIFPIIWR